MGCYGLTEPEAGSDAANQQTRAVKDGNDYILSGSKTWISCGTIATHALIFATVDPALGHKGITCFVVDTKSKGFTAQAMHGKLGLRASDTASLFLDEVRVPAENMLGKVGEGFRSLCSALDNGRFSSRWCSWPGSRLYRCLKYAWNAELSGARQSASTNKCKL